MLINSPLSPVVTSLARTHTSQVSEEEVESLSDTAAEGCTLPPKMDVGPVLSDNDLAVFDPCYKRGEHATSLKLKWKK